MAQTVHPRGGTLQPNWIFFATQLELFCGLTGGYFCGSIGDFAGAKLEIFAAKTAIFCAATGGKYFLALPPFFALLSTHVFVWREQKYALRYALQFDFPQVTQAH